MTIIRRCPNCRVTYWTGARHVCEPQEPQRPGSSAGTLLALAVWLLAVCVVVGWALWFCSRGR